MDEWRWVEVCVIGWRDGGGGGGDGGGKKRRRRGRRSTCNSKRGRGEGERRRRRYLNRVEEWRDEEKESIGMKCLKFVFLSIYGMEMKRVSWEFTTMFHLKV